MPSVNTKYNQEFRDRTCKHILDSKKSATSVGEEIGVDKNTICKWVREFRKKNNMPSYNESQGMRHKTAREIKIVNMQTKLDKRRILDLEEEVDILKKALHIFMQTSK